MAATIACHGSWRSLEAKSNFRGYWRDVLMDLIGFIVRNDSVVSVLMVQKVVLTFYNPTETFWNKLIYIYIYVYMVQRRPPPPLWMGHGPPPPVVVGLWWGSACFWCCWLSLVSSASPPPHGPPPYVGHFEAIRQQDFLSLNSFF